ncbi:hypothetical protein CMV_026042 [Castanea mollissima]|uniref:Uncharacterized protein n=1 Tax=Castanea mollissima TaxID=60419 RepID=A0A8J4Q8G7_9ROSI|nr:hypothetical protein CMV_026042 [Castanea mollissima]
MSNSSFSDLHLHQLFQRLPEYLAKTNYTPPEGSRISVKALIEPLLPHKTSPPNPNVHASIKDFALACALLSSSHSSTHDLLSWIPENLSISANSAFRELSKAYCVAFGERNAQRIGELGLDCGSVPEEKRLVVELMPEVMPLLQERIKESSIGKSDEGGDEVSAASARVPVGFPVVAAYRFRWFVTQGQGMISFIHLAKNVNAAELGSYGDVILHVCCQNIIPTILKLTWIRNTPYVGRKYIFKSRTCILLENLPGIQQIWKPAYACLCSAFWCLKNCGLKAWDYRSVFGYVGGFQILILLQQCKGLQFEAAWGKHKDDPNLANIKSSLSGRGAATVKTMPFVAAHL